MKKTKNIKLLIILLLTISILLMTIAFASISTNLKIKGIALADMGGIIRFENLSQVILIGNAQEIAIPVIKNSTEISDYIISVQSSGDEARYNLDVHNYGIKNAEIESITISEPKCIGTATDEQQKLMDEELVKNSIEYTLKYTDGTDLKVGDLLNAEEIKNLVFSVKYTGTSQPSSPVQISNLGIVVKYKEAVPKIELGEEELENKADEIIEDNKDLPNYVIGIDIYGNLVDMNYWLYEYYADGKGYILNTIQNSNNGKAAYIGPIENNTIVGEIPAYIIVCKNGVITKAPVRVAPGTFAGLTNLTYISDDIKLPSTIFDVTAMFARTGITKTPKLFNNMSDNMLYLSNLFYGCTSLTEIDEDFRIGNSVENLDYAFYGCTSLTQLGESFNVGNNVKSLRFTFQNTGITKLPENFTIPSSAVDIYGMFMDCKSLTALPENFIIPDSVTNAPLVFSGTPLRNLPDGFTIGKNVQTVNGMFASCDLRDLPDGFTLANATKLTDCSYMFQLNKNLIELPNGFTLPNSITTCKCMFNGCSKLTSVPDTFVLGDNVEDCASLFDGCSSLVNFPKNFKIPERVVTLNASFRGCPIRELNLIIPESVTDIEQMLRDARYVQGSITIKGNPTKYTDTLLNTASDAQSNLTVYYTSACTNINKIKQNATNAKVNFVLQ